MNKTGSLQYDKMIFFKNVKETYTALEGEINRTVQDFNMHEPDVLTFSSLSLCMCRRVQKIQFALSAIFNFWEQITCV